MIVIRAFWEGKKDQHLLLILSFLGLIWSSEAFNTHLMQELVYN